MVNKNTLFLIRIVDSKEITHELKIPILKIRKRDNARITKDIMSLLRFSVDNTYTLSYSYPCSYKESPLESQKLNIEKEISFNKGEEKKESYLLLGFITFIKLSSSLGFDKMRYGFWLAVRFSGKRYIALLDILDFLMKNISFNDIEVAPLLMFFTKKGYLSQEYSDMFDVCKNTLLEVLSDYDLYTYYYNLNKGDVLTIERLFNPEVKYDKNIKIKLVKRGKSGEPIYFKEWVEYHNSINEEYLKDRKELAVLVGLNN